MRITVDLGALILRDGCWSSFDIQPGIMVYVGAAGDTYTCALLNVPLYQHNAPTVYNGLVNDMGQEFADMIADLAHPHLVDDDPQVAGQVRVFRPYVEVVL